VRRQGWFGPIEWAAARRPRPDEAICGDYPIALGIGSDAALFGVLDGLGHGTEAATAATRAAETIAEARAEPLEVLFQLCHRALTDTRGVAMTLARLDFQTAAMQWIGVGNVSANLVVKSVSGVEVRSSARLAGGIVGYRLPEIPPAPTVSIRPGDLLVIASDGIAEDYFDSIDFAEPAMATAEHILDKHAKSIDDALVLTARHRGHS
jgi:negative regulator of sigma-B (phosphoserine phosphatase)